MREQSGNNFDWGRISGSARMSRDAYCTRQVESVTGNKEVKGEWIPAVRGVGVWVVGARMDVPRCLKFNTILKLLRV